MTALSPCHFAAQQRTEPTSLIWESPTFCCQSDHTYPRCGAVSISTVSTFTGCLLRRYCVVGRLHNERQQLAELHRPGVGTQMQLVERCVCRRLGTTQEHVDADDRAGD